MNAAACPPPDTSWKPWNYVDGEEPTEAELVRAAVDALYYRWRHSLGHGGRRRGQVWAGDLDDPREAHRRFLDAATKLPGYEPPGEMTLWQHIERSGYTESKAAKA